MPYKRKKNFKFNLDYFLKAKNIVPMVLIVIVVFFVFNLLQNKSFNPLFEGMEASFNEIAIQKAMEISGNITDLQSEISETNSNHTDDHEHTELNDTLSKLSTRISELSQHEKLSKQDKS